jgi:hypothetical protein
MLSPALRADCGIRRPCGGEGQLAWYFYPGRRAEALAWATFVPPLQGSNLSGTAFRCGAVQHKKIWDTMSPIEEGLLSRQNLG